MSDLPPYEKRGYLNEDWRIFSISSNGLEAIDYHYHEFHKIVFIRSGQAGYSIEGHRYELKANDVVLVPAGDVHRPEAKSGKTYDRIVLYISPSMLGAMSDDTCRLDMCFSDEHVIRLSGLALEEVTGTFAELLKCENDTKFGSSILAKYLVCRLAVILTRAGQEHNAAVHGRANDKKIAEIIEYINSDLSRKMTVDTLAEHFFISKYHMMRRFKEETGSTVHKYVTDKRLLQARSAIMSGESAQNAAKLCGFGDYSSFLRAYKKLFGESPMKRNKE